MQEDLFSWKVCHRIFFFFFYSYTFHKKKFSPMFNIKRKLPCSHYIFQSVFALNTRSIKTHRRSDIKVLITLLLFIVIINFIQDIVWLLTNVWLCDWTKIFDKYSQTNIKLTTGRGIICFDFCFSSFDHNISIVLVTRCINLRP